MYQNSLLKTSPQDRDRLKQGVLELILHGKGMAITGREMAGKLGEKNDRRIRLIIRELIREGVPIASSTDEDKGFYIAVTYKEWRHYRTSLHSRLVEDARRITDFDRAYRSYQYHEEPVQLALI